MLYNRSQSAISEIINELSIFLNDRWAHLFDFAAAHDTLLSPNNLAVYAQAVYDAGAPVSKVF